MVKGLYDSTSKYSTLHSNATNDFLLNKIIPLAYGELISIAIKI